jgi:hypothetical protein
MLVSIHGPDDSEFYIKTAMNIWGILRKRHIDTSLVFYNRKLMRTDRFISFFLILCSYLAGEFVFCLFLASSGWFSWSPSSLLKSCVAFHVALMLQSAECFYRRVFKCILNRQWLCELFSLPTEKKGLTYQRLIVLFVLHWDIYVKRGLGSH